MRYLTENFKMDIVLITLANSKASDLCKLTLNLKEKTSLTRLRKHTILSNIRMHY